MWTLEPAAGQLKGGGDLLDHLTVTYEYPSDAPIANVTQETGVH